VAPPKTPLGELTVRSPGFKGLKRPTSKEKGEGRGGEGKGLKRGEGKG